MTTKENEIRFYLLFIFFEFIYFLEYFNYFKIKKNQCKIHL